MKLLGESQGPLKGIALLREGVGLSQAEVAERGLAQRADDGSLWVQTYNLT